MDLTLINGVFNKRDAIELITQLVHAKITFHENQIKKHINEEDIKMREKKIKNLQKHLFEARKHIENEKDLISIKSEINMMP